MKVGFIGAGNMASAMIGGILNSKLLSPSNIIASAKTDKTFSALPQSLRDLLEVSKISSHYWLTGSSKKLKEPQASISQQELKQYEKILLSRLEDWRNFNKILISLINTGKFEIYKEKIGHLTIEKSTFNAMLLCVFKPAYEGGSTSGLINAKDLTPVGWENVKMEIEIFTLKNLFFVE